MWYSTAASIHTLPTTIKLSIASFAWSMTCLLLWKRGLCEVCELWRMNRSSKHGSLFVYVHEIEPKSSFYSMIFHFNLGLYLWWCLPLGYVVCHSHRYFLGMLHHVNAGLTWAFSSRTCCSCSVNFNISKMINHYGYTHTHFILIVI